MGDTYMTVYEIAVKDANGENVSLSKYRGTVLLIVNTATACGFTPQYTGLQDLYNRYHDRRFEILDFPCNQFLNQAPGTNEEIGSFCTGRFGITFRRFDKINVNGKAESPLYTWLKSQKGGFLNANIKWNFTKFLINRKGEVIARFAPTKTPAVIEKNIVKLLEEK